VAAVGLDPVGDADQHGDQPDAEGEVAGPVEAALAALAHLTQLTDRPSYRPEAAADGWRRIWVWFGRHLAT
jgi:hypothetical protein